MRFLCSVGVAFAFLMAPDAHAIDRRLSVDGAGTELTLVAARIDGGAKGPRALTLVTEPAQNLTDKAAQAAAESLFERYLMTSAHRYGVTRAAILVRSLDGNAKPKAEAKRTFRFEAGERGAWSLEGHSPTSVKKPYLDPDTVKLGGGKRIAVERVEALKARGGDGFVTVLRAEVLLEGLNPMMERSNIYLTLVDYWRKVLRPQADQADASAVEIVASFEPRDRRFQIRDGLELRLERRGDGEWPALPAIDVELQPLTPDLVADGEAQAQFGPADQTRLDLILSEILENHGATGAPVGLTSAHN